MQGCGEGYSTQYKSSLSASNVTPITSNSKVCVTCPELSSLSYKPFYPNVTSPSPLGSHTGCGSAIQWSYSPDWLLPQHVPPPQKTINPPVSYSKYLGNIFDTALSCPCCFLILIKFYRVYLQPPKSSRGLRTHLPESSLPLHPDGYLPVVFVICTSHCIILLLKLFSTSHYSQEKVNQSSCTHWTKSPPLYPASSGATLVPPHSAVAEQPLSSTQDQSHRPENFPLSLGLS